MGSRVCESFSLGVFSLLGQNLGRRPKCEHPRPWEWGHKQPCVKKSTKTTDSTEDLEERNCSENLWLIVLKIKEEREAAFACNVWVSRARGQSDPDEHLLKPPTHIHPSGLSWLGMACTVSHWHVLMACPSAPSVGRNIPPSHFKFSDQLNFLRHCCREVSCRQSCLYMVTSVKSKC